MGERLICPLRLMAGGTEAVRLSKTPSWCLCKGDKCAWYVSGGPGGYPEGHCAIVAITAIAHALMKSNQEAELERGRQELLDQYGPPPSVSDLNR